MKNGSWTGLPAFFPEDVAMLESSGAIRHRTRETLAPADIARLYRVLLRTISTVEKGEMPLGQGVDLSKVRGLHGLLSESCKWTQLVPDHATLRRDAPVPVEALIAIRSGRIGALTLAQTRSASASGARKIPSLRNDRLFL